jgi:membrane associated rhomboid family serine protease
MLLVEFGLGGWKVAPLSENPMVGPSADALIKAGARYTPLIVDEGQWYRIITPLFLHAGLIHFFINMAALWFVGAAVEQTHGMVNAMVLFFVPGVGGNILSSICLPQYISVGASGGIFGLIGGCLADIAMHWHLLFLKTERRGESEADAATSNPRRANVIAVVWLVVDIFLNVIIGFTPYVDNFCHLGGLVYGFACGWSAIEPMAINFFGVHDSKWSKICKLAARFSGLIFSVVMIIATTGILSSMNSDSSPCSNCRYISCIPFPPFQEDKFWYCDDCAFVTASLYSEGNDDSVYTRIELTCPNKAIENIPINATDSDEISKHLPTYCREWCDERFA